MKTKIEYRVPYADTDQMSVVYYANYLVYFERARNELLREGGLPYIQMEADGIMLPVIEAVCKYKNSAKYDDLLNIFVWIEEIKGAKIKIACEIRRNDDIIVFGHTVHVCLNRDGKVIKPPKKLLELVEK